MNCPYEWITLIAVMSAPVAIWLVIKGNRNAYKRGVDIGTKIGQDMAHANLKYILDKRKDY